MDNTLITLHNNITAPLDDIIKETDGLMWLVRNASYTIAGISIVPFKSESGIYLLLVNIYRRKNKMIYDPYNHKILYDVMTPYSKKRTFDILKINMQIVLHSIKEDFG